MRTGRAAVVTTGCKGGTGGRRSSEPTAATARSCSRRRTDKRAYEPGSFICAAHVAVTIACVVVIGAAVGVRVDNGVVVCDPDMNVLIYM